jgi:DNA-binding response OmpR family regulator
LLDWMMPVLDGLRTAQLLKADFDTRAIPIVMITTHAQIEDRTLALEAGVQDFITKPFDARELIACVDQQMRWRTIVSGAGAVGSRAPALQSRRRKRKADKDRVCGNRISNAVPQD